MAIAVVVLGAGLAVVLVILHKRKKGAQEKPELMEVDTTDDEDVDVYAMNDSTPAVPATVAEPDEAAEEPAEEAPAEAVPESAEEAPAEEAAAPAETPAEQSPETPSEE